MFRQLEYQDRVLTALDAYLNLLKEKKARSEKIAARMARQCTGRPSTRATRGRWRIASLKSLASRFPIQPSNRPHDGRRVLLPGIVGELVSHPTIEPAA